MSKIKVSIIVPAYNAEKKIYTCVKSIQNQVLEELEIIVIDDGSNDKTKKIVSEMAKDDKRIRLVQQKNSGVSNARNKGIEISRGKYLMFIDADDYIEKSMISTMYEVIEKHKVDVAQCNYNVISNRLINPVTHDVEYNKLLESSSLNNNLKMKLINGEMPTYVWDKIYSKEFIVKNNIHFDNEITLFEDWYFIMQVADKVKKYIYVNEFLYNYIIVENSLSRKFRNNYEELILNLQQQKIIYMKFWKIKDDNHGFIVSLYSDVIKCLDYIMLGSSELNKNKLIKKINYVINSAMIEKYFNFKNNHIFIKAINNKSLYLKIFLSLISLKKSISIYYFKKIIGKFK